MSSRPGFSPPWHPSCRTPPDSRPPPAPTRARGIVQQHHLARCTIMHLLATGLTPERDWPYATGLGPLTALWIRDSDGRWHATRPDGIVSPWGHNGSNPWTDTRMVTAWLRIIPPLNRGTAWIEISAA